MLTSNVFAILGLRSLYFLLAGALNRLHLLNYGLAFVLGFVGVKMLLEAVHVEVPIWLSLVVIVTALGVTTVLSLKTEPPEKKKEAKKKAAERRMPIRRSRRQASGSSGGEMTYRAPVRESVAGYQSRRRLSPRSQHYLIHVHVFGTSHRPRDAVGDVLG